MFNLQGSEIIVILLITLVVLGPEKLPDAVRRFTQTYNELKKMGSGFQSELKSALDEPMREMRETAEMVRDAADPDKVASSAKREPAADGGENPARSDVDRSDADGTDGERTDAAQPEEPPAPAPAPGDPPLADPDAEGSGDAPERINQVAAANASGALDASRRAAATEPSATDGDEDAAADDTGDERPASAAAGPAFHSAGPRRGEPRPVDDAPADEIDEPGESVESSDETATA